jgi:hypothetical protein
LSSKLWPAAFDELEIRLDDDAPLDATAWAMSSVLPFPQTIRLCDVIGKERLERARDRRDERFAAILTGPAWQPLPRR